MAPVSTGAVPVANATFPSQGSRLPLLLFVGFLSVGTGSLDAAAFVVLGEAFASVMTGNLVILGLALGTWSGELALFTGVAVTGYIVGGLAGSALARERQTRPQAPDEPVRRLLRTLGAELVLLTALSAAWAWQDGQPTSSGALGLMGAAAMAMGAQGAAVRTLPVRVSTTYLTGALTTVLEAVVNRRRFSPSESAAVVAFLGLIGGAALGAVTLLQLRAWTLGIPVVALALAMVVVVADLRRAGKSDQGLT